MNTLFSDEVRRNPYPIYAQMRSVSPVHYIPPPFDAWMILDYPGVKRALTDFDTFSSQVPAPPHWFIFSDPPVHTNLRGVISQAFTSRAVAKLEPRVRQLSRTLLDAATGRSEMDLAADYSVPLPMMVVAGLIGIPASEWPRFNHWSDVILKLNHTRLDGEKAAAAIADFRMVKAEMADYLAEMIEQRRVCPGDDVLTRLVEAEIGGQRLTPEEILGFVQLLIVAGQETTTNLINNAMLCFMEHPDQLQRLRERMDLLPGAIEEVLRYRSPAFWMMRTPKRDVEVADKLIPAGKLVLAVIGAANRDPQQFPQPDTFDISREPNAHIAFGHGIHFCLGAPLARLEARIAITDILETMHGFRPVSDEPWEPRQALNVYGPARLPIRFERRSE